MRKYFVKVDKWYASSQIYSKYEAKNQMETKWTDIYMCRCGNKLDRDINAAINIKMKD